MSMSLVGFRSRNHREQILTRGGADDATVYLATTPKDDLAARLGDRDEAILRELDAIDKQDRWEDDREAVD